MKFREINIDQLVAYVESEEFRNSSIIPITPQRAYSQSVNPAARQDDVVLTIAYNDDNEIIGYIGALPDNPVSDKIERMAWNSCWWVDPDKGSEASMPLFLRFLQHWDQNVLFSEMTPHTFQIVNRMGFFQTKVCQGFRGYMRLSMAHLLPSKHVFFHRFKRILYILDGSFNFFWNFRLKIWLSLHRAGKDLSWEFIEPSDNRVLELIEANPGHYPASRGQEEFIWIRNNPWVLEGRDDEIDSRYYFTSYARTFNQRWILISEMDKPVVFMVLNNRNGHLKIPYIFSRENHMAAIREFLVPYMIRDKILYVTTFNEKLAGLMFVSKIPLIHRKSVSRFTGISKQLIEHSGNDFDFQDGDGDVVFT